MGRDGNDGAIAGARSAAGDRTRAAATASPQLSASIGGIAVVYSRSPTHMHYSLADIEWLILPAVLIGQFYVVEAANDQTGFRGPIAAATWAFVSPEVDARLSSDFSHRVRLRPDEWRCGEIGWIVDWAGDPRGVSAAIGWLKAGPFKYRNAKIVVRDLAGQARVATLDDLAAASAEGAPAR
jgi:hemolysin-activating ACP:hemolysin acyltransferase